MNDASIQINQPDFRGESSKDIQTKPVGAVRKKRPYRLNRLISIVVFFIVWEIFSRLNEQFSWFNPIFLPAPTEILQTAWDLAKSGVLLSSILSSTIRLLAGFVIGTAAAVLLGMIMVLYSKVEDGIAPILNLVGPIPALALLPIFIIWFGIGEVPKILLIAWTIFIPVHVYTLSGLKSVNQTLIRSAMSLGASDRKIFLKVILPSAIPSILVGAEVSLGLGFSSLIVSEMMGAKSGLGYIIVDARNYFKLSNMFVAVVTIGLEFSLFSMGLKFIERRVVAWKKAGFQNAIEK